MSVCTRPGLGSAHRQIAQAAELLKARGVTQTPAHIYSNLHALLEGGRAESENGPRQIARRKRERRASRVG